MLSKPSYIDCHAGQKKQRKLTHQPLQKLFIAHATWACIPTFALPDRGGRQHAAVRCVGGKAVEEGNGR